MDNEQFWLLMTRRLAGEATKEEEHKLDDLMQESEELRARFAVFSEHWKKSNEQPSSNAEVAYRKIMRKMDFVESQRSSSLPAMAVSSRRKIWITGIAASVVGVLIAGIYFFAATGTFETAMTRRIKKQNLQGEHSKIVLPDGSFVWLNTESELEYPEKFASGTREVYLKGEAFFDVTKNPDQPFIIHLENGTIRVLGTSFNVKAFPNDVNIETSVVTGKVAFIPTKIPRNSAVDTVLLIPNQKVIYSKTSFSIATQTVNSLDEKAWIDGLIIFKSTRFEDVAKVLARTYSKHVVFKDDALRYCELTARFDNNSLEEIMELLAETKDYKYTITRDSLVISGSGCVPSQQMF